MRMFAIPTLIALTAGVAAFWFGGLKALSLVAFLTLLEVTLSFDNAVVNAKVLKRMSPKWEHRFLTWGIPIAVFGTRVLLPVLIVATAAKLSPLFVLHLALFDSHTYGLYVQNARTAIAAFGGAFLLLVALKFFIDDEKEIHWISSIEHRISRWGGIAAIEVIITLTVIAIVALLAPTQARTILFAGILGVVASVGMEMIVQWFEGAAKGVGSGGVASFIYLELLDAAFSLDGVVGAFAVTSSIPIIIAGLGVGALFVRSFTIALVHRRALESLRYLEHGAHWAIFGLAICMFASLLVEVPEVVTGSIGILFVALAYLSSRRVIPLQ